MKFEEVIVMFTTNFGNLYRNIFLLEKVDKMKFAASFVLNVIIGIILILYEKENTMPDWMLITIALGLGLVSQTVAAIIINFATTSEKSLGKTASEILNKKIKQTFNINDADDKNNFDSN